LTKIAFFVVHLTFEYSGTEHDGNNHLNVNGHTCIQIFFFSQTATSISTEIILRECVEYHAHHLVVYNTLQNHTPPLLTIILAITLSFVGKGKGKGKRKVHPITGHEGPEVE
jgi:hypothetical protein